MSRKREARAFSEALPPLTLYHRLLGQMRQRLESRLALNFLRDIGRYHLRS
jgi:hypothetical protein